MRILLIGLPTSGKSFVGKELSEKLNLYFVDQDEYMQKSFSDFEYYRELFTQDNLINSAHKISSLNDVVVASSDAFGTIANASNIFDITIYLDISEELFTENIIKARKSPYTNTNKRIRLVYENDNFNDIKNRENIKEEFDKCRPHYKLNADYTFSFSSSEELFKLPDIILNVIKS